MCRPVCFLSCVPISLWYGHLVLSYLIYHIVTLSYCHLAVFVLPFHLATLHLVILLSYLVLSSCYLIILSYCCLSCLVILLLCILSSCCLVLSCHLVTLYIAPAGTLDWLWATIGSCARISSSRHQSPRRVILLREEPGGVGGVGGSCHLATLHLVILLSCLVLSCHLVILSSCHLVILSCHHFEILNIGPLYHPRITPDPPYHILLGRG